MLARKVTRVPSNDFLHAFTSLLNQIVHCPWCFVAAQKSTAASNASFRSYLRWNNMEILFFSKEKAWRAISLWFRLQAMTTSPTWATWLWRHLSQWPRRGRKWKPLEGLKPGIYNTVFIKRGKNEFSMGVYSMFENFIRSVANLVQFCSSRIFKILLYTKFLH